MPKTDLNFNPDDYAPVADRIRLFYDRYPTGRILTHLVSRSGKLLYSGPKSSACQVTGNPRRPGGPPSGRAMAR